MLVLPQVETQQTSIKWIPIPMPFGSDLILRLVAELLHGRGNVQKSAKITVDVVGDAIGDEEFLRAFVIDS